ncbi:hypothetical protein C8T65DRAFT_833227 [Cerioporus squamosus]|nr:hypothetical protein C8T65DRAFT_833227 [Cerioporus squamosus]
MRHSTYPTASIPSPARSHSQFAEVRMLDALATLCSMHPLQCRSAAIALEVSPEGLCLLFATAEESHPEVRRFVDDCFEHVLSLFDSYQTYRARGPDSDRGDIIQDEVFMARKRAFVVSVHKQCYREFRWFLRTGAVERFRHKLAPGRCDGAPPALLRPEEKSEFWRLAHVIWQSVESLVKRTEPASADEQSFSSSFGQYLNCVVDSSATRISIVVFALAHSIASLVDVAGIRASQRIFAGPGRPSLRTQWIDSTMVPSIVYRVGDSSTGSTPTPPSKSAEGTTTAPDPRDLANGSADAHPATILVHFIVDKNIAVRPHIALAPRIRHCSGTIPAT